MQEAAGEIAQIKNTFSSKQGFGLIWLYHLGLKKVFFFPLFPQKISMLFNLTGMRHAPTSKRTKVFH
jgi:hypothetical protein